MHTCYFHFSLKFSPFPQSQPLLSQLSLPQISLPTTSNFHLSKNFHFQIFTFTQSKPGSHCHCTSHGYCSSNNFWLSQCLISFLQVSLSQCSIPKLSQFSTTWELLSRDSALLLLLTELRDKERSLKDSDFLTCIKIIWLTLNRSS